MHYHFVRLGAMSEIFLLRSVDGAPYRRGARVVCRTDRGLFAGEVLTSATHAIDEQASSGDILRSVGIEDELLLARLDRKKHAALISCDALLREVDPMITLIDADLTFDGSRLYFYFLGEASPELDQKTAELAQLYETKIEFARFADSLTHGCGPECGTEAAAGCGSGGCSTCSIATACGTGRGS